MPKKFGTNTKSAEARGRKEAAKQAEKERKEREAEDALWEEDDKHALRKQQRKEDREKKKQEVQDKKLANKVAYEEEMSTIKAAKPLPTKVTRAEITSVLEKQDSKPSKPEPMHDEKPLEENVNKIIVDGDVARSVEDAIAILSLDEKQLDRHPERRQKAAYQAFEDINLPRLKSEHPNLRLSQLKQILKKDWMKSPENPMNQRHAAYNSKV